MPRPTCASALWPARSSKPWPAIPTGTLPMRRRGGIISGGSASPTWRSIPTRSASPPKARCGGDQWAAARHRVRRRRTVRARGLVLGPCRAPNLHRPAIRRPAAPARAGLVVLRRSQGLSPRPPPAGGAARPLRPDLPPPHRLLDRLLDRLYANKDELLRVLDRCRCTPTAPSAISGRR